MVALAVLARVTLPAQQTLEMVCILLIMEMVHTVLLQKMVYQWVPLAAIVRNLGKAVTLKLAYQMLILQAATIILAQLTNFIHTQNLAVAAQLLLHPQVGAIK